MPSVQDLFIQRFFTINFEDTASCLYIKCIASPGPNAWIFGILWSILGTRRFQVTQIKFLGSEMALPKVGQGIVLNRHIIIIKLRKSSHKSLSRRHFRLAYRVSFGQGDSSLQE